MAKSVSGSVINKLFNVSWKYRQLKENPEKKDKSVKLGVSGLIESICYGVIACLLIFLLKYAMNQKSTGSLSGILFGVLIAIIAVVLFACLVGEIFSIVNIIYQFKLNKRSIRWVALAIWLVMIAVIIIVGAVIMTSYNG